VNVQAGNGALDAARSIQELKSAAEKFREEPPGLADALPMISWGLVSAAGFAVMQVLFAWRIGPVWGYLGVGVGIGVVGALAHAAIALAVGKPRKNFIDRAVGGLWFYNGVAMGLVWLVVYLSGASGRAIPACVMLMLAVGYGAMGVIQGLKYYRGLGLLGFGLACAIASLPAWWPMAFAGMQLAGLTLPGLWLLVGTKRCPKTSTT